MTDIYTAIPVTGAVVPAYAQFYAYHAKKLKIPPESILRVQTHVLNPATIKSGTTLQIQTTLPATGYLKRVGYISADVKIQLATKCRGQKFEYEGFVHDRWADNTIHAAGSTAPAKWTWRGYQGNWLAHGHAGQPGGDGQRFVLGKDSVGGIDLPLGEAANATLSVNEYMPWIWTIIYMKPFPIQQSVDHHTITYAGGQFNGRTGAITRAMMFRTDPELLKRFGMYACGANSWRDPLFGQCRDAHYSGGYNARDHHSVLNYRGNPPDGTVGNRPGFRDVETDLHNSLGNQYTPGLIPNTQMVFDAFNGTIHPDCVPECMITYGIGNLLQSADGMREGRVLFAQVKILEPILMEPFRMAYIGNSVQALPILSGGLTFQFTFENNMSYCMFGSRNTEGWNNFETRKPAAASYGQITSSVTAQNTQIYSGCSETSFTRASSLRQVPPPTSFLGYGKTAEEESTAPTAHQTYSYALGPDILQPTGNWGGVMDTYRTDVAIEFETFSIILYAFSPQSFLNAQAINVTHEAIDYRITSSDSKMVKPLEPNIAVNPQVKDLVTLTASMELDAVPDYLICWVEADDANSANGPENFSNHRLGFPIVSCVAQAGTVGGLLAGYPQDELKMRSVEYGATHRSRRMFAPFAIHSQRTEGSKDHQNEAWSQNQIWTEPGQGYLIIDPDDMQLKTPDLPGVNVATKFQVTVNTRHPMWKHPALANKNFRALNETPSWNVPDATDSPWIHHGVSTSGMNDKLRTAHDGIFENEVAFNQPVARNVALHIMAVTTTVFDVRPGTLRKGQALFTSAETAELLNSPLAVEGEITTGAVQRNAGQGMGTTLGGGVGGGLGLNTLMRVQLPSGDDPMGGPAEVSTTSYKFPCISAHASVRS